MNLCTWLDSSDNLIVKTNYGYYNYANHRFRHKEKYSEENPDGIDTSKIRLGSEMIYGGALGEIEYSCIKMKTKDILEGDYEFYIEESDCRINIADIVMEYGLLSNGVENYIMIKPVCNDVVVRVYHDGKRVGIYKID